MLYVERLVLVGSEVAGGAALLLETKETGQRASSRIAVEVTSINRMHESPSPSLRQARDEFSDVGYLRGTCATAGCLACCSLDLCRQIQRMVLEVDVVCRTKGESLRLREGLNECGAGMQNTELG